MNRAETDSEFEKALQDALLSFRCAQDEDIEDFLHSKAVEFFNRGWCSVYILFNEEAFNENSLVIEAYFTLSHKSLVSDSETMSTSSIRRYGGFKTAKTLNFVLIGQLGKWVIGNEEEGYTRSAVSGEEILDKAFEIIHAAAELIPCRYAMVECSDNPNVIKAYTDYGFTFFQKDGKHNQYCKLI